tara:strand:+ start:68 stop:310 length:243 start_codon:yes stop_codon:yes gene_type:complete
MNKDYFDKRKQELIDKLNFYIVNNQINEKEDYEIMLRILDELSFSNRLIKKGLIAFTIVDSLTVNQDLESELIIFDDSIS